MTKQLLLFIAPVASRSGYGEHSRDILRSLIKINKKIDKYDIHVLPIRWGMTPLNVLKEGVDNDILDLILKVPHLDRKPDISIQLSVPNEFNPDIATFNIGITAGIETTMCSSQWIEGMNKMNFNIVPSNFAKSVFENTNYTKQINGKNVGETLKCVKPIFVLFEGVDDKVYGKSNTAVTNIKFELNKIKEDFLFLFVGHWLNGDIGQDRKDVGMLIKVFMETFKNVPNPPALLLKTGSVFSKIEREELYTKINAIKSSIQLDDKQRVPNIYVLFGDLTPNEMNSLYNHSKVKAHVTFTKGEGFGRPLLEASLSEKIIIASGFSGHVDFLPSTDCILLPGAVEPVHPSAVWQGVIEKDSKWFTVNYQVASNAMFQVWKNPSTFAYKAKNLAKNTLNKFTLDKMTETFEKILNENTKQIPIFQEMILPELKLPKLTKIEKTNE